MAAQHAFGYLPNRYEEDKKWQKEEGYHPQIIPKKVINFCVEFPGPGLGWKWEHLLRIPLQKRVLSIVPESHGNLDVSYSYGCFEPVQTLNRQEKVQDRMFCRQGKEKRYAPRNNYWHHSSQSSLTVLMWRKLALAERRRLATPGSRLYYTSQCCLWLETP